MVQPLVGLLLDSQRIAEKPRRQPEGQYQDRIKDRKNDTRLEVSNLVREILPALPRALIETPRLARPFKYGEDGENPQPHRGEDREQLQHMLQKIQQMHHCLLLTVFF